MSTSTHSRLSVETNHLTLRKRDEVFSTGTETKRPGLKKQTCNFFEAYDT